MGDYFLQETKSASVEENSLLISRRISNLFQISFEGFQFLDRLSFVIVLAWSVFQVLIQVLQAMTLGSMYRQKSLSSNIRF